MNSRDRQTERHLNNYRHRMCEPRSASEAISTQIASESECQAGCLTERHLLVAKYGDYELVFASEEAIEKYAEPCLESISENEMYEAWQLYHISVRDLLEKVFSHVMHGRTEAYFLLFHNEYEEKIEVLGIGGIGEISESAELAAYSELGESIGEIWFMGQSLAGHKRFLVRHGRQIVAKILTKYSTVLNIAAAWNDSALQLVKFLGFTVGKKAICTGVDNALFKCFYKTKK